MKNNKLTIIDFIKRHSNINLSLFVGAFCLLMFASTQPVKGQQEYFSFPTDSATWSEYCGQFLNYPSPHWEYNTMRYFLNGDTTIDSKEYSLVYGYVSPSEEIDTLNASLMGGLREDSLKKIYFLPISPDLSCQCYKCNIWPVPLEIVLYQFDVGVGDTAFIGPNESPWIVSSIDSILIDSNYRKKYNFSYYGRYWIEGIGSSYGLFGPMCQDPFEGYVELLCYEGVTTYYSKYGYCMLWYYVSVPDINEDDLFTVYSNPDYNRLYFKLNTSVKGTEINLYNNSGNLLKSLNCRPGQNDYVMDFNKLPSGLYIAVLLNNGQVVDRKKVFVNN